MFQKSVLKSIKRDESIVAHRWAEYQNLLNQLELEKIPKKLQKFDEFVKEYKKVKKLKFVDKLEEKNFKNEWKALFENDTRIVLDLKSQIKTTDKEINSMVYELYGLSDEEIKVIKGA
ncbi:MAG: hypothetical protein ACI9TV_000235 [Sulfurimonas sp.]|jgi:hypothetical protein|uniref:hypothetical protein n=1 Tax=Sulfurimonas sp. TaxID=2022749 RepID=UPI0039E5EF40